MRAYIDSDILIWHLRGERKAASFLHRLRAAGEYELWTGAMQRAEVVFFMRPSEEAATLLFLSHFQTAPINAAVVDLAADLYHRWHPSHGMDINDTFLAASVLQTGGRLFTLNVRHFPIPDLPVKKAW